MLDSCQREALSDIFGRETEILAQAKFLELYEVRLCISESMDVAHMAGQTTLLRLNNMSICNPCVAFIYPCNCGLVICLLYAKILMIPRKFFGYTIKLQNGSLDPQVYRCLSPCSFVTVGDQRCIRVCV
jgi:hypothetical protein